MSSRRARALWIACASVVGLVGCAAQARSIPSSSPIAPANWPPRITAGLKELAANTPHAFELDQADVSHRPAADSQAESGKPAVAVVRSVPAGLGIVLELRQLDSQGHPLRTDDIDLAFVSFSPLVGETNAGQSESNRPTGNAAVPARRLPETITPRDVRGGVAWHLYMPNKLPPRGMVVHLGGNKYVRRALLKHGWAVLNSTGTGRFFQHRTSPLIVKIDPGDDLDDVAARLAARFDDELADWPYSLEAVLEYLAEYHAEIPQKPLVVMGFSIGALGLPAVVARLPDRFEAAVIVAGGANLLEIARRSHKSDRGIAFDWSAVKPTPEDWQQLSAAYLKHAQLDPYQTAPAVARLRILMFHALFDQVVPAATGDLLYARLGKPERLVFPVGHRQLLRMVMWLQAGHIAEWTDDVAFVERAGHPKPRQE